MVGLPRSVPPSTDRAGPSTFRAEPMTFHAGPSTFQVPDSFAKSFYGIFSKLFPVDENGLAVHAEEAEDSEASGMQLTPEEIARVMAPKTASAPSQALPSNASFHSAFGHPTTSNKHRPASNGPCANPLSVPMQSAHPVPPQGRTPCGPPQCLSTDSAASAQSMVIRRSDSMVEPSIHMEQGLPAACASMALTPYGPAPVLGSFDVNVWNQEKRQHQQLMQQHLNQHQHEQPASQPLHRQTQYQNSLPHQPPRKEQKEKQSKSMYSEKPPEMLNLLDQHVEYHLHQQRPGFRESRRVHKKRPGCYEINGREVMIDWEHNDPNGGEGFLVAIDGNSRQAFKDYLKGVNAAAMQNAPMVAKEQAVSRMKPGHDMKYRSGNLAASHTYTLLS